MSSIPDKSLMIAIGAVIDSFYWTSEGALTVREFERAMDGYVDPTKMLRVEAERLKKDAATELTHEQHLWLHRTLHELRCLSRPSVIRKLHKAIKEREELEFKRTAFVFRMHSYVS